MADRCWLRMCEIIARTNALIWSSRVRANEFMEALDDDIRNIAFARSLTTFFFFSFSLFCLFDKCGNANCGCRRVTLTRGSPQILPTLGTNGPSLDSLCDWNRLFWGIREWNQRLNGREPMIGQLKYYFADYFIRASIASMHFSGTNQI